MPMRRGVCGSLVRPAIAGVAPSSSPAIVTRHHQRHISFNGLAWISSLRYGFPFGPQLGSFVHQYCNVKDLRNSERANRAAAAKARAEGEQQPEGETDSPPDPRTIVLDDIRLDPELQAFTYDHSPCYAGNGWIDAKAAKLLMQRRHDAADALHCKRRPSTSGGDNAATTTSEAERTNFRPTLTFDLLRQIRQMYSSEMLAHEGGDAGAGADATPSGGPTSSSSGIGTTAAKTNRGADFSSASLGSNRATSALDEVFLDDAAIYSRALVYVSGGSRLARDWLAGCAALSSNHPSLITIAMQHQGTHEDLEDFARYCEIVAYSDADDCSLLPESQLCEKRANGSCHRDVDISRTLVSYNANAARCGECDGDGVIIDLPVPLTPTRQADIVKRCLIYDAMSALHFMEYDADLLDLSRIRAAATYLRIPSAVVEDLREVVLAEHSLISEKHSTIDSPPAGVEGSQRGGSTHL